MTIILDKKREDNQNGRTGCFLLDGPRTHMVEVVGRDVVITASEGYELERLHDLNAGQLGDFVVRSMDSRISGFDGKALVGLFGLDVNTSNSRAVYLKGERVYQQ